MRGGVLLRWETLKGGKDSLKEGDHVRVRRYYMYHHHFVVGKKREYVYEFTKPSKS
jgi:hypothetical protein